MKEEEEAMEEKEDEDEAGGAVPAEEETGIEADEADGQTEEKGTLAAVLSLDKTGKEEED